MKRNNIKGFTIVELTIVIAVIAILAAVLIPTFSSVVDKANQSADVQLVRQANVVLQAATADGSPISEDDAIKELENNSIKLDKPSQTDCVFYYLESENRYVIFNTKTGKATYPEDLAKTLAEQGWKPTYELTYDWNLPTEGKTFANGTYMDTGYVIDFSNDFTITETIYVEDTSKRLLLIGCYGQEGNVLNIEINSSRTNGSMRIYTSFAGEAFSDDCGQGVIQEKEDIVITFKWDSTKKEYTATAKGDKTDITMTGTYQISDKCSQTMYLGKDRRGENDRTFGAITVKSLQITTQYHYGNTVTNPSDPIYNVHNANGNVTATWDKRVTSTTTGDQIITATWSN